MSEKPDQAVPASSAAPAAPAQSSSSEEPKKGNDGSSSKSPAGGKGGENNKKGGNKKEKKPKKVKANAAPIPEFDLTWLESRNAVWDEVVARTEAARKAAAEAGDPVKVTLPDGTVHDGVKHVTTPMDVARKISTVLAQQKALVAEVNGDVWDMSRPFEGDATLKILTWDDDEAKKVFWHSSAHMLGLAMERTFGAHLCIGPPLDPEKGGGFYYDCSCAENFHVSESHFPALETVVKGVAKEKQTFTRMELTKDDALRMFSYNKYKCEIIEEQIPEGGTITAYRNGPLIDLCRGPHIPHTGKVKAFLVDKNSSAFWRGDAQKDVLQRVYGMSFPDKKLMDAWKELQEQIKLRDHRRIGIQQELFFFHPYSPGSAFWSPHGARIYNRLVDYIKGQYWKRDFQEVITPNIFSHDLFARSGHLAHYKDNLFNFEVEHNPFALKPMNCPGHAVIFGHRVRSYRELPLRFADFGVLHRNELSGALSGLTRVRRFQQDDAHIFCAPEQVKTEIDGCLDFLSEVYGIFGFEFDLELSTRPEGYLGSEEVWDRAEAELEEALNTYSKNTGKPWKLNPGDGAFYGPKIDIHVRDVMQRSHQLATIQLDFTQPERFDLAYTLPSDNSETAVAEITAAVEATELSAAASAPGEEATRTVSNLIPGKTARPVMIHRAVLGSVERMVAILTEHTAGKWPFWLNPRQICIIPVVDKYLPYADKVRARLHSEKFFVDVSRSSKMTLKNKIRVAQESGYNFIIVVGDEEEKGNSVNVRARDSLEHEREGAVQGLEDFVARCRELQASCK